MDKKYDFQKTEEALQEFWERESIYQYQNGKERKTFSRKTFSRKIFSVDTPPPTVSGKLHIGHVFSYTQAEIIARFKRMQGYDVFYPFGFDDNGLPTERLVERDEKIRANMLPRSVFRAKCMQTIGKYEAEFKCGLESGIPDNLRLIPENITKILSGTGKIRESLPKGIPGTVVYGMPDIHCPGRTGDKRMPDPLSLFQLSYRDRAAAHSHHQAGTACRMRVPVCPSG